jgi:sarcosine oxidase
MADDGAMKPSVADIDVDVAVVGLGVLGAATLAELSGEGLRAVGLERFGPGHANGSSHGRSRAVRFPYHAPEYVALLRPAIERWRQLEMRARRQVYWPCGTFFFARPGNRLFEANLRVASDAGVGYEILDRAAAERRFPAFAMTEGARGIFLAEGGMVDADAAVRAFLDVAERGATEARFSVPVLALDLDGDHPAVRTATGTIRARHVVVAAGAWTTKLLPELRLPVRVTQQSFFTMRPGDSASVGPDRIPVWCDYDTMFYGFPDHGPGLKVADDTPSRQVDPDTLDRTIDPTESATLTAYLAERFPTSRLELVEAGTCLYTLTPDEDFLLGPVPGTGGSVSLVLGLNHAFKFAPVIGRILADLATKGSTAYPIDRFRLDRFASVSAA